MNLHFILFITLKSELWVEVSHIDYYKLYACQSVGNNFNYDNVISNESWVIQQVGQVYYAQHGGISQVYAVIFFFS